MILSIDSEANKVLGSEVLVNIIWQLALIEIDLSIIAIPNHLIFLGVFNCQAVNHHIIAIDLQPRLTRTFSHDDLMIVKVHIREVRRFIRCKLHMVSPPQPQVIANHISLMNANHDICRDLSIKVTSNTTENIGEHARIAWVTRICHSFLSKLNECGCLRRKEETLVDLGSCKHDSTDTNAFSPSSNSNAGLSVRWGCQCSHANAKKYLIFFDDIDGLLQVVNSRRQDNIFALTEGNVDFASNIIINVISSIGQSYVHVLEWPPIISST
mmetsp:Transcript_34739/g.70923  ORF Transcript_34739/g.70923 Transcript_34739/m.70923 type:complete len:269 (-) Transcript_34739:1231-2037(-)